MSFGFEFTGECGAVANAIREAKMQVAYGQEVNNQAERAKEYAAAEVDRIGVEARTGPVYVTVKASGHADIANSYVTVDVRRISNFVQPLPTAPPPTSEQ